VDGGVKVRHYLDYHDKRAEVEAKSEQRRKAAAARWSASKPDSNPDSGLHSNPDSKPDSGLQCTLPRAHTAETETYTPLPPGGPHSGLHRSRSRPPPAVPPVSKALADATGLPEGQPRHDPDAARRGAALARAMGVGRRPEPEPGPGDDVRAAEHQLAEHGLTPPLPPQPWGFTDAADDAAAADDEPPY
jgi:hypothetical protein